jgi:hypothetical protein
MDDPEKKQPSIVRTLVEAGADIQFVGNTPLIEMFTAAH